MLPESTVQAPDLSNWLTRQQAADLMKINKQDIPDAVMRSRITTQVMFGFTRFYKPDCERAAVAIAEMRAKRAAA